MQIAQIYQVHSSVLVSMDIQEMALTALTWMSVNLKHTNVIQMQHVITHWEIMNANVIQGSMEMERIVGM